MAADGLARLKTEYVESHRISLGAIGIAMAIVVTLLHVSTLSDYLRPLLRERPRVSNFSGRLYDGCSPLHGGGALCRRIPAHDPGLYGRERAWLHRAYLRHRTLDRPSVNHRLGRSGDGDGRRLRWQR